MDLGDNLACDFAGACGGVFDFTGLNAGVVGGRLYANFKLGDATTLGASGAYLTNEEDEFVDATGMFLAAGLKYQLMENTTLQAQLQYTDASYDDLGGSDGPDVDWNSFQAGTGLFVKF